jgi:hypothetical protein
VAAVETTPRGSRAAAPHGGQGLPQKEVEKIAKRDFAPGSNVVSDGLSRLAGVLGRLFPDSLLMNSDAK